MMKKYPHYNDPFPTNLRALMSVRRADTGKKTTHEQLASAIGVAHQTVGDYMNGVIAPDVYRVRDIAEYFNVSVDELIGWTVAPGASFIASQLSEHEEDLEFIIDNWKAISSFIKVLKDN